ncbi:MAG TPA: thiamine-phosphate kinase [Bacteroidales bacterium]|nr:thiamine-phosphate kinase [Bacteroidales bacterium]HPF02357.1 thiamine-phosphate kinase [Bacteroidales bacterium]HPJ58202.1 thiamine-phosphate kinase [Bacteroidales bacterium]HPR11533.1 thiamine-phosphate kinase [Bacteroidales bacterium]HRW84275.1 thiamine-phosphate kinase [Bacteroidales bacterium]
MNETGNNKTPLAGLGKYGLIDHLAKDYKVSDKSTVMGVGDDATVIDNGKRYTLVSTDLLLEGIHFNLVYSPLKHLGYKAVIRAISDIFAMNGAPSQVLIALGISSRFFVEDIHELYEGAYAACKNYGADLAGGDTSSSLTGLTISVTAVGSAERPELTGRKGAQPNDLICVTGDLGAAYCGLQILERERRLFEKDRQIEPDLSGNDYVIGRQLKPEIPSNILNTLKRKGIRPTSMIDITEGLASDLMQICKASGTGCRIFSSKIPIDHETVRLSEEFNIDPLIPALNGGDDFEFLFTVPAELYDTIISIEGVKVIGHITSSGSGNFLVGADNTEAELTAPGWKK